MAVDPTISNVSEIVTAYVAPDGFTVVPVALATPLPVALPDGPLPVSLPESPLPVVLPNGPLGEVSLPTLFPEAWASGVKDMRAYSGVTIQVHGLSGGDTIQISESWDGTNAVIQTWVKNDLTVGDTISADGNYLFIGGGYMAFARTGNVSTPTLTIAGSN